MAEALKEIAEVLKDALVTPVQEAFVYRARNPFFGTLVISWLFYNWNKVAYFFLSDDKIIERINYINNKIPDNSVLFGISIPHTHSIFFPFLWAAFISLTFPFFTYASIWVHKKITGHIETINSDKEINRIKLQKELMVEMAKNESAKALQLAIDEAQKERFRENSEVSRANIEAIKVKKKSLEEEIGIMEAQQAALKNTLELTSNDIEAAQERVNNLNQKHKEISSKYSTFNELASSHRSLETKFEELKEENLRLVNIEESSSKKLADLDKKYRNDGRRLRNFDSQCKAAMIALQEAKEMADKGEHPGMKIQEARIHLGSAISDPVLN